VQLPTAPQSWNLKFGFFRDAEKNWKRFSENFEKFGLFMPYFLENLPISVNF